MKTNMAPYVLMTKAAMNHVVQVQHKSALISVSSIASDNSFPWQGVYSGTKHFNEKFATTIQDQCAASDHFETLIDFEVLKPSITTTKLAGFKKGWMASST